MEDEKECWIGEVSLAFSIFGTEGVIWIWSQFGDSTGWRFLLTEATRREEREDSRHRGRQSSCRDLIPKKVWMAGCSLDLGSGIILLLN